MIFNAYFISKDPYEEVDEYLCCENKLIIHHVFHVVGTKLGTKHVIYIYILKLDKGYLC